MFLIVNGNKQHSAKDLNAAKSLYNDLGGNSRGWSILADPESILILSNENMEFLGSIQGKEISILHLYKDTFKISKTNMVDLNGNFIRVLNNIDVVSIRAYFELNGQ